MQISIKSLFLAVVVTAALSSPPATAAPQLGRVVAMGDSLASGQWLGPQVPGSIADCGQSTGGYPELAMARVTHGAWVNASCNGTTADNFQYGWTGPSGATIPPQYSAINGDEDLVIVGSGSNEAFFGKIAYDCTGYQPAVDAFFHNRDFPQQPPQPIPNHCSDTYLVGGVNQIPQYVAISKTKIATALTQIHQRAPQAKILLVGTPRIAKPSGSQCFSSEFWLTATDAPLYATWEEGVRQAMIDDVNAFNSATPGNYAHYVDMQAISGTAHTACEPTWGARWMNPHTYQQGLQYPGIALHNTPLGASVMADAIVDAIHAFGFDTGSTPNNPVVSISTPASTITTTNATIPVTYSASDNIRIASCTFASGASVALSPGTNTIVITCLDDAGNAGSDSVVVKRDATPPAITISAPASGSGTTAATTQLNYTASDDVGTPSCTPASGTTIALATGANTLSVSCTDSVGRSSTSSTTIYRGTPPVVTISAPTSGTNTQAATINVAYSVGNPSVNPGGTTCKVNGAASNSGSNNSVALSIGSNTITVSCTNLFGSGSNSVAVNRGNAPVVAITAPANGANTTSSSVNVAFTVDGASQFPVGTNCKVGALSTSSATNNPVELQTGSNPISVSCTNQFGTGTAGVTVNRGSVPVVAITAPLDGANTTASSVNVAFTVDGVGSIPAGTTCSVRGAASSSATTNPVALSVGANPIAVTCANAFGPATPASVTVNRGIAPAVAISTPVDGAKTTAGSVNVAFTVGGNAAIPVGTTCTVGGVSTSSATSNPVSLSIGQTTITVGCSNAFGSGSAAVAVTRGVAPLIAILAPADNVLTSAQSVNVAFSLNGVVSIPADTACTINDAQTGSAATNAVALALGSNTITVACTSPFGFDSKSVTVVRGVGPKVTITAPTTGLNTTATSVNLAFTVDGAASIPAGTTCSVGGLQTTSAAINDVTLALGPNSVEVVCSNTLGADTQSVVITRGTPPTVVVTSPLDHQKTTAATINVAYTVDGATTIPNDTDCSVDDVDSTSPATNVAALEPGDNTITVACSNVFGTGSAAITVTRGNPPAVAITAPADGLKTTSGSINVAYTVNGAALVPAGTTCDVNSASSADPASNLVRLAFGATQITVSCSNAFGPGSDQVTVERGAAPQVAITAPEDGLMTAAQTAELAFTVDGAATLPTGTSCKVNGQSSSVTSSIGVALGLGANPIVVSCSNAFDTSSAAITVTRGDPPAVAITAPLDASETSLAEITSSFTVDGAHSIPLGASCSFGGAPTETTTDLPTALTLGANTIFVTCTNAFGSDSDSLSVTRLPIAKVSIVLPTSGSISHLPSTAITFLVDGTSLIPAGTACSVGGEPTTTTSEVVTPLALGENTIEVSCTDAYGSIDTETVLVSFIEPPVPPDPGPTPQAQDPITPPPIEQPAPATITAVSPRRLRPLRSGAEFSRHKRRSAAKFKLTLASGGSVGLSLERLTRGHNSRRVSAWSRLKLPSGQSTIYISGRARGRALAPGRYRVRMIVRSGDQAIVGRSFRITR